MQWEIDWNSDEIHLENYGLPRMPDSPTCPNLVKLFLRVPSLVVIPPTFFEHMPVLEVLDLSNTNIVSLPTSISILSLLKEFFLRDCSALVALPTQIGMLSKLKLFDIKGTELMVIPKEMGNLKDLEILRISLSQYAKDYIKSSVHETVIPQKTISQLTKLKELCVMVSVGPEPEWWEEEVKFFQNELCDLENLETLRWYLPTTELLHQFLLLEINHVPIYAKVSNLMLTIGQHAQLTSCLPRGLEKKFEETKNCLKWINAEGNMDDISKIMASAEALFLSRHWTIQKLSTFNATKLKYCLLAECNEMETLVDTDDLSEDAETRVKNSEIVGFELLQYLSIHYMEKLKSIWKGPIGKDSLSKLRILALHTCEQLTSIFAPTIAQNFSCLVELIIEDCPKVTSLISNESHNIKLGSIFPSLEKIFLLDLPMLVNIFDGRIVLEKLRTMLIYSCLQLRDLSNMELPHLNKIEGDEEWWKALDFDKSPWENIFVQLKKQRELVEQLFEATNSLQHFHDTLSQGSAEEESSNVTDMTEQMITDGTSMEKGRGILLPPKGYEKKYSVSTVDKNQRRPTVDRTPVNETLIKSRPGDWNCRSCQHLNFQRRDSCQRCGEMKHGGSFGGRGSINYSAFGFTGLDVRPGDWYCNVGNCGAHNFASRSSCFKCGASRDGGSGGGGSGFGGGSGGGGGSRSGWKSGDWICTRPGCNEHNFVSRMECFRCNAPRDSGSHISF